MKLLYEIVVREVGMDLSISINQYVTGHSFEGQCTHTILVQSMDNLAKDIYMKRRKETEIKT